MRSICPLPFGLLERVPVLDPLEGLEGRPHDSALEDGLPLEVDNLADGVHPGSKGALDRQVNLQTLRPHRVVDDADVYTGVVYPEVLDDQDLQMILDPLRGEHLSHPQPLHSKPTGKKICF